MRRMACAIFSIIFAVPACATEKAWSVDTSISDTISTQFEQQTDILASSVDEIIEKIRGIDPNFVWFLESSGLVQENKKVNVVRSYLAYKSYETYKNKFLADLKQRSQETGREIKTKHFESSLDRLKETHYWLDRGRLDQPECHLNGDVNDAYVCKFPDGFEDFFIVIKTYFPSDNTMQNKVTNFINEISGNSGSVGSVISVIKDMPQKNVTLETMITISNSGQVEEFKSGSLYETFIGNNFSSTLNIITSKYDEIHEWRNQEVADTLAGKHDVLYTEETSMGTRIHERQEENMTGWKSNWLPAAHIKAIDFMLNSTHNQAEIK